MTVFGMLRVKNEARWIRKALASIAPLCEEIHVLDDHSTDETRDLCTNFDIPCKLILWHSPFEGLDEARDKTFLLDRIQGCSNTPDWVLAIDGDEELTPESLALVRDLCARDHVLAYRFRVLYLWDGPHQVRVDGVYGRFRRSSLFRLQPGARFRNTRFGGNFHCSNAPAGLAIADCAATLLHYGYLDREDRIRKFHWYNQHDPNNRAEDCYRHMVIGDLYPADSRFAHAGPLAVESLP